MNASMNVLGLAQTFLANPLVLSLLRIRVYDWLHEGIYSVLRQVHSKPDVPDELSIKAADGEPLYEGHMSGLGVNNLGRRTLGPRTWLSAMTAAFPASFALINRCLGQSNGRCSNLYDNQLSSGVRRPHQDTFSERIGREDQNGNAVEHRVSHTSNEGRADDLFGPTVPLQALLESTNTGYESPQIPPQTPPQIISRAPPFLQTTPRPVRRPTESGQDVPALPTEDGTIREQYQTTDLATQQASGGTFRVTLLSVHPADSLAWHTSTLLTTLLLLPLEAAYLRTMALAYLSSQADLPRALVVVGSTPTYVMSIGEWLGGSGQGLEAQVQYMSSLLLSFGMEACASTALWYSMTGIAVYLGRKHGWGQY